MPHTRKNLAGWISHFQKKIKPTHKLVRREQTLVVHVPETYLVALMQMTYRKNNWPGQKCHYGFGKPLVT
ncbi:dynein heavy chain 10, axonemal [Solenopsis invicta]|uniref:dynein heavy chain 10, axonemal n=1 Tax=Solenopsis invicta TaxID=13686 RepID=UPI000595D64C|nr:dynein heavy chain 10, axonemal [Solenopsis invicta]